MVSPLLLAEAGSWLPEQASTAAEHVDWVFGVVTVICLVFLVGIVAAMVYFVVRYRSRPLQPAARRIHHNTWLEVLWSVVPAILLAVIFVAGLTGFMRMAEPPNGAYGIKVTGKMWVWSFQYPNGYIDDTLHVPVDRPIVLTMTSDDVIHSMYIPAFRVKRDVIPGRYTKLWFEPTQAGEFDLFCAEYCGTKHSDMITTAVVHPPGEFDRWLEKASNFLETMTPAEAGKTLYRRRGCAQCHSIDGSKMVGPSFYESFGKSIALDDGSSLVIDENYIRESILEPQAKAQAGYRKVMPTYQGQLKDPEIDAIIEYIKTLK
ncbi:MAG: cytochrome c oxidase subunit II [Planctomycetaceae bacterium]